MYVAIFNKKRVRTGDRVTCKTQSESLWNHFDTGIVTQAFADTDPTFRLQIGLNEPTLDAGKALN